MMRPAWSIKSLKPNPQSLAARLPQIYKDFQAELKKEPSPVHYIPEHGKWKISSLNGKRTRVQNVPIPLKFPKQADEGIWGGEGVIQGFVQENPRKCRYPNFWIPNLKKAIVYSEILNKYMSVTVTERALQLIDGHCGFDNYILETSVQDIKSQLALDLRRKLLLALVNKERYYDDITEQEKVWEKYKRFEIPKEEAEWFGLNLRAAIQKQRLLEETIKLLPLKQRYRQIYFEKLKSDSLNVEEKKSKSWMPNIPFFGEKT